MASLVHDDIVDGAHLRRGRAAAWTAHGADAAKAAGDHLFAAAFALLARTGSREHVVVLADASLALARGEALQRLQRHDPTTSVEAYLERCALKTGSLFAAACVLGGGSRDLRPVARDRVPDRRRRARLHGRDRRDGKGAGNRPSRRDADAAAPPRRARGRGRPARARGRAARGRARPRRRDGRARPLAHDRPRLRAAGAREPERRRRVARSSKASSTQSWKGHAEMAKLGRTIPALPARDVAASVAFYNERLGFETLHHDGGFAVLMRDDAIVHLWESSDERLADARGHPRAARLLGRRVVPRRHGKLPDRGRGDRRALRRAAAGGRPPSRLARRRRRHRLRDARVRDARSGRQPGHVLPLGERSDPARPHLVRQHGAGLPPADARGRGGDGRPDRAQPDAARRRDRRRADLVDRVRAERVAAPPPAAALRLVRGRRRLDPARDARPARPGAHGRRHARERDVRRPHAGAPAARRDPPARSRRGRAPADRRRGAPQRLRGSDAAPRPRSSLARAHGPADGVRGVGRARAGGRRARRPAGVARRVGPARALRARAARARGERPLRLPGGIPRPLLREAPLQLRAARARRVCTRSSRWRGTSASSSTCRSCVSSQPKQRPSRS